MKRLPPHFDRIRMRLKKEDRPQIVVDLRGRDVPTRAEVEAEFGPDGNIPTHYWGYAWYEMDECGLLIKVLDATVIGPGEWLQANVEVTTFDPKDGLLDRFRFNPGDPTAKQSDDRDLNTARHILIGEIVYLSIMLGKATDPSGRHSVDTLTRNDPAVYAQRGDTIRYDRIDIMDAVRPATTYRPPSEPSGIRKREHEVCGHWRTYKSGVRVYVKPHKRGDPELGRVTRVLQ